MHLLFEQRRPRDYLVMALLYFLAYLYCIPFAVWATKRPELSKLNAAHEDCLFGLCVPSVQATLQATRGKKYIITEGENSDRLKSCLVTFWSFSHFLLYFVLGLVLPHMFLEVFFIGLAFELYEYKKFQCHDALDILFNTTGFLAGRTVRLNL